MNNTNITVAEVALGPPDIENGISLLWPGHLDHPATSRQDVVERIQYASSMTRKFVIAWQACSFYSHNERVCISTSLLMEAKAPDEAINLVPDYK